MSDTIRVFLCDGHLLFRHGVKNLLELEKDIQIVGQASNGQEALNLLKKTRPDVILMDIEMSEMDGITATSKIKRI